jgi:predicted AAA+ superfamily ATPase
LTLNSLPTKVGSPLSITSLSGDLKRKYDTVKNWIETLEALYMVFTLRPWHRSISRAIKKDKKLYFSDWSLLFDAGRRFENLLAVALCRMAARFTESGIGEFEVCYIRDREKRKVDFVLAKDKAPIALFEAKTGDSSAGAGARYFSNRLSIPLYQIVLRAQRVEAFPGNCFLIPAANFLMLTG